MKLFSLISLFLVLSFSTQAQDAKKGLKNYYKGKLDKAEEEFTQMIKAFKSNPLANYGMALLQSDTSYTAYDLWAAYASVEIAFNKAKIIRPNELEDLADFFTKDSIELLRERINGHLLEQVRQADSLGATRRFLAECSQSQYISQVKRLELKQEYRAVKDTNTIESFNWFMAKYPNDPEAEEALGLRDNLAWDSAKKTNTQEAYQFFLENYPNASQYDEAEKLRNELAYNQTMSTNTVEAYRLFITSFPDAPQLPQARQAIISLEFATAQKTNTDEAWAAFIEQYAKTPEAIKAAELREKLAFENAKSIQTQASFEYFMKKYPESQFYGRIFDQKATQMAASFSFAVQQGTAPTDLKMYDYFNTRSRAEKLVKLSDGWLLLGRVHQGKKWQTDAWLIRVDAQGKQLWNQKLGKGADDALTHAIQLADKSILLAGFTGAQNASNGRIWLIKLAEDGKTLWERTFDGLLVYGLLAENNQIQLLINLPAEDQTLQAALVTLSFGGDAVGKKVYQMKSPPQALAAAPNGQFYLLCQKELLLVDAQGVQVSETTFDKYATALGITLNPAGGFWIWGKYYDFPKDNKSDMWLASYDANAKQLWQQSYDRAQTHEKANALLQTPDGNLLLCGLTEMDNQEHLYLLQVTPDGTKQSETILGGTQSEKQASYAYGADGKLYLLFSSGLEPDLIFARFP